MIKFRGFAISCVGFLRRGEMSQRNLLAIDTYRCAPRLKSIRPVFPVGNAFEPTRIVGMLAAMDIVFKFRRRADVALKVMRSALVAMIHKAIVPKNHTMHEESLPLMTGNRVSSRVAPRKMIYFWDVLHVDNGETALAERYVGDRWANRNFDWTRLVFVLINSSRHGFLHQGFAQAALTGQMRPCFIVA